MSLKTEAAFKYERERTESWVLPVAIKAAATLTLVCGLGMTFYAIGQDQWGFLGLGLSSLLSSPFLFGFADMVLSLRKIAGNQQPKV